MGNEKQDLDEIYERNAEENVGNLNFIKTIIIIMMSLFACFILYKINQVFNKISDLEEIKSSISNSSTNSFSSISLSIINSSISLLNNQQTFNFVILIAGLSFGIILICIIKRIENNTLLSDVIMKKINQENKKQPTEHKSESKNSKQ